MRSGGRPLDLLALLGLELPAPLPLCRRCRDRRCVRAARAHLLSARQDRRIPPSFNIADPPFLFGRNVDTPLLHACVVLTSEGSSVFEGGGQALAGRAVMAMTIRTLADAGPVLAAASPVAAAWQRPSSDPRNRTGPRGTQAADLVGGCACRHTKFLLTFLYSAIMYRYARTKCYVQLHT